MALKEWVRLPTGWIEAGGLQAFHWGAQIGSDNAAALMTLVVLAHNADELTGAVKITYDELVIATHLSRAKISRGLTVLEARELVDRGSSQRSTYLLRGYGETPWGKLPAKRLYRHGGIWAFEEFFLRRSAELNALKLYFLFVARRGSDTNLANISYDKITEYSGVERGSLKTAISLLAALGLVHVEHVPSAVSEHGVSNGYRLAYIDPYAHMGTRGRGMSADDFLA